MRQYFYHSTSGQRGPFVVEELKQQAIGPETLVWYEGLAQWTIAGTLDELATVLRAMPPPLLPPQLSPELTNLAPNAAGPVVPSTKMRTWHESKRTWLGVAALFWLVFIISFFYWHTQTAASVPIPEETALSAEVAEEKTPEQLRVELWAQETATPLEYLRVDYTVRENLIGEKVFEGTVTNSATIATFKDVVLKITYITGTHTVLGTESFVLYKYLSPGGNQSFKVKKYSPEDADSFSVTIEEATAAQ